MSAFGRKRGSPIEERGLNVTDTRYFQTGEGEIGRRIGGIVTLLRYSTETLYVRNFRISQFRVVKGRSEMMTYNAKHQWAFPLPPTDYARGGADWVSHTQEDFRDDREVI